MKDLRFGPIEWLWGDEYYRPSLWIAWPQRYLVIFFGWQRPSVLRLWR